MRLRDVGKVAIGDTFEFRGHLIRVKKWDGNCDKCFFTNRDGCIRARCESWRNINRVSVMYNEVKL
jgi:hypothetical protein